MRGRLKVIVFVSIIITIFMQHHIMAQDVQGNKYPRGAQYFLGTEDELLMNVNIWGFVNKPGQYMVPSETDLISLISYAGGPAKGAKLSKIKLIHAKSSNENREKIMEIDVSKYLDEGIESIIPVLKPGDTILVSGSTLHHINSFVEFTTKIAFLAQIYYLIAFYSSN